MIFLLLLPQKSLKQFERRQRMIEKVVQILARLGAVIDKSHLVYTSGKHGSAYINKDAIYPHTAETSHLCELLALEFVADGIEVVIAPAVGGCILSNRVAEHLTRWGADEEVLGVYADKDGDGFVIKRGYDKLVVGKRVLVVEDVLTTGGSAKKVIEAVRAIGGHVIGLGALCNRGGITKEDMTVPKLFALLNVRLDTWDEADCPLCQHDVPINTDVGEGRKFLAKTAVTER